MYTEKEEREKSNTILSLQRTESYNRLEKVNVWSIILMPSAV